MSGLSLTILQPVHDRAFADAELVPLQAQLAGDPNGLFFKWFSSLNVSASLAHPELNTLDHSLAILNWSAALPELGTHAIVLSASDRDANDLAALSAVTRAAMSGGAPPAPAPRLIHRVRAELRAPLSGATLSKASTSIKVLAPVHWAKLDEAHPGALLLDTDYQQINGLSFTLRFTPAGPANPAATASLQLTAANTTPVLEDNRLWLSWIGPLPANLGIGSHELRLLVQASNATAQQSFPVVLTA